MYKIKTFNKIDNTGLERLPDDFEITEGNDYDGIILRSYKMSEAELTDQLSAIARAGAGVNNIPVDFLFRKGCCCLQYTGGKC